MTCRGPRVAQWTSQRKRTQGVRMRREVREKVKDQSIKRTQGVRMRREVRDKINQ